MIYTKFQNDTLSQLGFGCMRFATNPDTGEIDQKTVNEMFDLAIANGVNYFDTAYPYLGGKSELAMTEALKKYPRSSYYIADKFPGHSLPGPIDNIALFNVSLRKCNTDYFDYYLLHNITEWSVKIYESEEYHILPDLLKMKEEGKIRHLGFSFHGGNELLEDYLTRHEGVFEFVQIQCNYLDWTLQKAREKCEIIARHGLDIWIMEPCRGGKLASLPEEQLSELQSTRPGASAASFAFRFLQNIPHVKMILSGMNNLEQVKDNLATFASPSPLSENERQMLFRIAEGMKSGVPCTACRYCCSGCPKGLDIPFLLECYNSLKVSRSVTPSMRLDGLDEDKKPDQCIGCGQCAHACPQGINVPAAIEELADLYANGPHWSEASQERQKSIRRDLHMDANKETYQDINARTIDRWVEEGWEWGQPISHDQFLRAQNGDWDVVLTTTKHVPKHWFGNLKGKKVLGLASGGGQQMPILTAAGAECTVLDYSPHQLESEKLVAEREGYSINIIRADMTQPLPFADESFDLIFHPVSNVYVKEVKPIFRECFRVLKKGGYLLAGLDNGVNFLVDENETAIVNSFPFDPTVNEEQRKELEDSDCGFQFSHTLDEQIGGQLEAGFHLLELYEDTNGQGRLEDLHIPTFFATLARKD